MKTLGKRLKKAGESYDKYKQYSLEEGIKFVKTLGIPKFDPSVEVHIHLGIDPKKSDQNVRGTVVLPHGTGKIKRVIAFVDSAHEQAAKNGGADIIGDDEKIQEIKNTQKIDFDIAVATPSMMKKLAPIAKILGQKGLMPNPKTETVTPNIEETVKQLRLGSKVSFRSDDTGNVHQVVGKASQTEAQLLENSKTFLEAVKKVKPDAIKGTFLKNVVLCSSMGPAVHIEA